MVAAGVQAKLKAPVSLGCDFSDVKNAKKGGHFWFRSGFLKMFMLQWGYEWMVCVASGRGGLVDSANLEGDRGVGFRSETAGEDDRGSGDWLCDAVGWDAFWAFGGDGGADDLYWAGLGV